MYEICWFSQHKFNITHKFVYRHICVIVGRFHEQKQIKMDGLMYAPAITPTQSPMHPQHSLLESRQANSNLFHTEFKISRIWSDDQIYEGSRTADYACHWCILCDLLCLIYIQICQILLLCKYIHMDIVTIKNELRKKYRIIPFQRTPSPN